MIEHELNNSSKAKDGNTAKDNKSIDISFADRFNHPAIQNWIVEFIGALFDFSFSKVVTVKMLPLMYGLSIIALLVGIVYVSIETILTSPVRGTLYLLVIGPLFFVFGVAALRAVLEFFSAVFRLLSYTNGMVTAILRLENSMNEMKSELQGMRMHIENLSGTMDNVDRSMTRVNHIITEFEGISERIPFLKNKPRKTQRPRQWTDYRNFDSEEAKDYELSD